MTTEKKTSATFAHRLRQLREEAGVSRYRLAKDAQMSRIHVTRLERGDMQPRLATLERLAQALGCGLEAFA